MKTSTTSLRLLTSVRVHLRRTERRREVSDLERAAVMLAHAIDYLVSEQIAGRRGSLTTNREAIAVLCEAFRAVDRAERREPARAANAAWLRPSHRARAAKLTNHA